MKKKREKGLSRMNRNIGPSPSQKPKQQDVSSHNKSTVSWVRIWVTCKILSFLQKGKIRKSPCNPTAHLSICEYFRMNSLLPLPCALKLKQNDTAEAGRAAIRPLTIWVRATPAPRTDLARCTEAWALIWLNRALASSRHDGHKQKNNHPPKKSKC